MTELSTMSKNWKEITTFDWSWLIANYAVLNEFSDVLQETSVKYVKLKVIHN